MLNKTIPMAQYRIGDFKNFLYVWIDWDGKDAALIDVHKGYDEIISELSQNNVKISTLLLTHSHWDHISDLEKLIEKLPEIRVGIHALEVHRLPLSVQKKAKLFYLNDGDHIPFGKTSIHVIHTPGHSAGECSFWAKAPHCPGYESVLFSGDTLFIRDCGRTDLESGDVSQMFDSLQKIKKLPAETRICPGHQYHKDAQSTLAVEARENPSLLARTVEELAQLP